MLLETHIHRYYKIVKCIPKSIHNIFYNLNDVDSEQISGFDAQSADEAAKAIVEQGVFVNLENPVAAAAAIEGHFVDIREW